MEAIQEFLFRIFAIIIFCTAIGLLLSNLTIVDKMVGVTKDAVVDNDNMYATSDNVVEDIDIMTADEVISYLISGIEYDVSIDGVVLNGVNFDRYNFNYAFISNDYYSRSYEYDGDNNIQKVKFTSIVKTSS